MCNKTIIRLILKLNCNSYRKSVSDYSYSYKNIFTPMNYVNSNLNQLSVSTRRLCTLGKNISLAKNYAGYHGLIVLNSNKFLPAGSVVGLRSYCSNKENDLPKIMDFPEVIWPSMFKSVRNWILSNFIIMRYFDNDFNLQDFVAGSKQAVESVSGLISRGDINGLNGLVTPEVIIQVRNSLNKFTFKQSQEFAIRADDVYFCFPYEVGVMFPNEDKNEGENQSRFVEITMCYHALLGFKELKEQGISPPLNMGMVPEYQQKIFICNYRFIREFTKGVQGDWTINAINHFKPSSAL